MKLQFVDPEVSMEKIHIHGRTVGTTITDNEDDAYISYKLGF